MNSSKELNPILFQSTLPVWGATVKKHVLYRWQVISIHAPRVGSDSEKGWKWVLYEDFNPRSPCGERPRQTQPSHITLLFQSTLPVWGATLAAPFTADCRTISIHAPRVGSDPPELDVRVIANIFQSTLPVWGATSSPQLRRS